MGGFPSSSDGKVSAYNVGDLGSIPGLGGSPVEGNGSPFQNSSLGNSMDGGAWYATVHGIAKSRTRLSNFTGSLEKPVSSAEKANWQPFYLTLCQYMFHIKHTSVFWNMRVNIWTSGDFTHTHTDTITHTFLYFIFRFGS